VIVGGGDGGGGGGGGGSSARANIGKIKKAIGSNSNKNKFFLGTKLVVFKIFTL
jgi:hypothetical protein